MLHPEKHYESEMFIIYILNIRPDPGLSVSTRGQWEMETLGLSVSFLLLVAAAPDDRGHLTVEVCVKWK